MITKTIYHDLKKNVDKYVLFVVFVKALMKLIQINVCTYDCDGKFSSYLITLMANEDKSFILLSKSLGFFSMESGLGEDDLNE